ncbi:unnamed protein product [Ascophyllum nodosum]
MLRRQWFRRSRFTEFWRGMWARSRSVSTIGGGRGYDDSVPGEVTKTT